MSTDSPSDLFDFPDIELRPEEIVQVFRAEGLPPAHEAEADTFARHRDIPAHNQESLAAAHVIVVGSGGLGGPYGLGAARSGIGTLTFVEHDRFDRTNAPRQLMYAQDLGQPKAHRVAANLVPHMVGGGQITGVALTWQDARDRYPLSADLIVCLVDNNECRLDVARHARSRRIPAVFTMLSDDGMRCQTFLQGASPYDACLHCAKPDLDPERAMPCVSAIITSCLLAAAFTLFFTHRALCGWGELPAFNWRQADLTGIAEDRSGWIEQRPTCPTCSPLI